MIGRKTAHRLAKEWFSTVINYGTLPSLIFRCEHMILTHSIYCQDDSRKIMDDLLPLLEFLKHEKNRYDSKPSYRTIQRIIDACFFTEKAYRFLVVQPRITKTTNGSILFLVKEYWDQSMEKYKGLSPVFSVWSWEKDKRPKKLYLDKIFSKQYVFSTFALAKDALKEIKEEYRYHKPRQGKIVMETRHGETLVTLRLGKLGKGRKLFSRKAGYYPESICIEHLTQYAQSNEIELN